MLIAIYEDNLEAAKLTLYSNYNYRMSPFKNIKIYAVWVCKDSNNAKLNLERIISKIVARIETLQNFLFGPNLWLLFEIYY